jgi:pimeloyl-ACP methyl ester carboxylesterase
VEEPTQVAVLASVPVEHRLVPGTRGTVVVFHGGHQRAGLPLGEAALVEGGYTVLTPSRPGYGRTPLSAGPGPERFAETTAALCSHLGLEEVLAVVGVSAGGPTAVAMAALHPARVRSVVLHSARSSLPFPDGAARWVAPVVFHRRVEAGSWATVRQVVQRSPGAGLRAMMASLSTLPARRVVEDLSAPERSALVEAFAGMRSGAGFVTDVRHGADPRLERAVTQPALVVASRTDGQVRWQHAEQLSGAIPRSELWASPSLSHLIWFGSGAAATSQRTQDFLAAV